MTVWATYEGEEIEVEFSAASVWDDYGVPGSPRWKTLDDITVEAVRIYGVKVNVDSLPPDLVQKLYDLHENCQFEEVSA